MQLKNKLRFGIGFLLMVALVGSGLRIYFLNNISVNSTILQNNCQFTTYIKTTDQIYRPGIIGQYVKVPYADRKTTGTGPAPAIAKYFIWLQGCNSCIEGPLDSGSRILFTFPANA